MQDFRNIQVWQKSHQLVLEIYTTTNTFPNYELYGLTSQIRRSAISIPANIAEGCGKGSDADMGRFLQIAMGSASELEYHMLLSHDLSFIDKKTSKHLTNKITEIKKMLAAFIKKLKADIR